MSKHQWAGSSSKKTLTIEANIKLFDSYRKKKQNCKHLTDQFNIGKTAAAKINKKASNRQEYERFKENLKRNIRNHFRKLNEILCEWLKKCCNIWKLKRFEQQWIFNVYWIHRMVGQAGEVFKAFQWKGSQKKRVKPRVIKNLKPDWQKLLPSDLQERKLNSKNP